MAELVAADVTPDVGIIGGFGMALVDSVREAVANEVMFMSNSNDYRSMLIQDRERTEARHLARLRAGIEAWCEGKTTWEKSRHWALHSPLLRQLYPQSVIVAMVRDPRDIIASIEKQHQKFPAHDEAQGPAMVTLRGRTESLMSADNMVGACILAVEDLLRRDPARCIILDSKTFVADPKRHLEYIYTECGLPLFDHDLDDVKNVSGDVDGLYLNKFPHEGSGKVEDRHEDWRDHIDADLGAAILSAYPFYCEKLGYN